VFPSVSSVLLYRWISRALAFDCAFQRRPSVTVAPDRCLRKRINARTPVPARNPEPLVGVADLGRRLIPFSARMLALFVALLAALRSAIRSRLELEAEILAIRHQLAVLQRQAPKRPRLGRTDRLVWILLSRLWPNWRRAIQIVTPGTVVRWHRRGFALYWQWRSRPRRAGRPAVDADLRDRDGIYGEVWSDATRSMGTEEVLTAPRSPWQNPFVERVIGSIRRECLDHVVIWNERALRHHLGRYLISYHQWRTHVSLDKDAPTPRATQTPSDGRIVAVMHIGGLRHPYERRAA